MLIIVTGGIGIGKSTVCRKVVDGVHHAGYACGGIITAKAEDGSIIVEDVQSGQQMILATVGGSGEGPRVGRYTFNPGGLAFGADAIKGGVGLPLLVVDEIGPLELAGGGFADSIRLVREERTGSQIVVIRKELLSSFLPLFDRASLVLETAEGNRDRLPQQITRAVTGTP